MPDGHFHSPQPWNGQYSLKKSASKKSPHFEKKSSKNPPSYGRYPVSSGRDTAIAINENDGIFSMENVSVQDSGEIQFDWFQINGRLKNVSVHRGVAWGVDSLSLIHI